MKVKTTILLIFALLVIYCGSYLVFRQTNIEIWEKDNREYVIFPENKVLYYLFRPLVLIDEKLTNMRFHIGQHR